MLFSSVVRRSNEETNKYAAYFVAPNGALNWHVHLSPSGNLVALALSASFTSHDGVQKKIQSYLRTDRFSNPGRVLATIKHVIRVEVQLGFDLTSYLLRSMVLEPDADSR